MSKGFMQKIYDNYKANNYNGTMLHGQYEYSIDYNPLCAIQTWIVRKKRDGYSEWEMYCPLPIDIH